MSPLALNSEALDRPHQASRPLGKYRPGTDFPDFEEYLVYLCYPPCVWAGNGSFMFASTLMAP